MALQRWLGWELLCSNFTANLFACNIHGSVLSERMLLVFSGVSTCSVPAQAAWSVNQKRSNRTRSVSATTTTCCCTSTCTTNTDPFVSGNLSLTDLSRCCVYCVAIGCGDCRCMDTRWLLLRKLSEAHLTCKLPWLVMSGSSPTD